MFKIKPLNRESISDDDVPVIRKEAQEENALAKYNKALKLQCSNELDEAEDLLQSLLDEDIPEIEQRGGLPKTMSTFKYSCYLNIGKIAALKGTKQKALDNYLDASKLDKTDVTLWHKIGTLALELNHFKQSAFALSQGLECNKNHWPSLDKLITLLYAMRDMVSCLWYISHGLQLDPDYTRGLMLRKRIYERNPGTQDYYQLYNPDYIYDPPLNTSFDEVEGKELENESTDIYQRIRTIELEFEPKPLPILSFEKPLQEFTWLALGESIVHMHNHIAKQKMSFICRIDLSKSIGNKDEVDNNIKTDDMQTEDLDINMEEDTDLNKSFCTASKTELEIEQENKNNKTDIEIIENDAEIDTDILENDECVMEIDKDEKQLEKNNDTCIDDVFSTPNSKSNSQQPQEFILPDLPAIDSQEDESDQRKSESDNTDANDCTASASESATEKVVILGVTDEKTKTRSVNRRRRNSLSFLQPWAWHAKRKSNRKMGKNDKDDTIEGSLRRIISNNILPNGLKSDRYKQLNDMQQDDSLNTMDLYKMFIDEQEQNSDLPKPDIYKNSEAQTYFGTRQETEEVEEFWKYEFERCDIMFILEKYVATLATKWELKWPEKLKSIYIEAYEMYREHFDHPQMFSSDIEFYEMKIDAEVTILYGELLYDAVLNSTVKGKTFPCSSMGMLELVCTRKSDWGDDYLKVCLRLQWLKANILMNENSNDLAIRSLNSIIYLIRTYADDVENYCLHLPNCIINSLITLQNTEKLLKSFEMIKNLGKLESLYENKNYEEVIKILKESFEHKSTTRYKTKTDRPVQIVMLLHAIWLVNREECLIWSEICLNESLAQYIKSCAQPDSSEYKRWSMVVVKCLVIMEACIKEETIIIVDSIKNTQTRLVENLTSIICHQFNWKPLNNDNKMPLETVKPWIILHYILQREEHRVQAKRRVRHSKSSDDSEDEQNTTVITPKSDESEEEEDKDPPPSIQILFSAHDFLGKRSWCLDAGGELLLFMVDVVLYRLNAPIFEGIKEKIEIHLEQAFFCLFQHPSKKNKVSRHLADHNVNPLSLTWEHAHQLYEFYQPKALPEFDSYRYSSISSEMEQLLLRILALVPSDYDPQSLVPKVNDFINGQSDMMPDPIKFPDKVAAVYYLLGDYYLKLHDPVKGLKYFVLDLCVNPTRLDTWADMALGMASQLETKLNHCENFRNEAEFLDKARSAQICFKQSLHISDGHSMLWIEYGNFVYMSHSFCSRLLKGDTDMFSMEKFEALESQKEAMLDVANECFTAANIAWQASDNEHDERWLHHYMLGKIAEKRKQEPAAFLDHYNKAAKLLFENKATYPLKINYSNPQHLSMEALEIHYRIHASILKYLELHEDKPMSRSVGRVFQKYLKECNNGLFSSPLTNNENKSSGIINPLKRPPTEVEPAVIKRRRLSDLTIFEDVASTLEDMLKIIEAETLEKKTESKDDDVVMIIDSDDDITTMNKLMQAYKDLSKKVPIENIIPTTQPEIKSVASVNSTDSESNKMPKIRVKNAEEIMDDMMKKCMANQPEYKSETETDAEVEGEKGKEIVKSASSENIQKQIDTPSSPSRRGSTTSTAATTTSTSDSSSSSSSDESSDSSSSSDSESSETESSKSNSGKPKVDDTIMTQEELKKLIDQCLYSLEQCVSRFPQNYKAIYRLTHFYLNNKTYKDLAKCKQLMLTEYSCSDSTLITGLFSDRKVNNFFNGVWRIPTSEIDRPGSFACHMSRCIQLLMQVLREIDDHKILLDLCLTLKKVPDPDKIYIRESERQQLSDQALSLCIQSIRGMLKRMATGTNIFHETEVQLPGQETNSQAKLVLDLYRGYLKVQKYLSQKESLFSGLFVESYKLYMQNKIPENVNVLDLAVKFCQQRKAANRLAIQQANAAAIKLNPPPAPITTQASLPTSPSAPAPLRKTAKGIPGRPRGRPPNINKHLTGPKPPKAARDHSFLTPSSTYSWQNLLYSQAMSGNMDANAALNFMMSKYQEELIRQYSNIGGAGSLLSNPFAVKNAMNVTSSGVSNPSFTSPVNRDTSKASLPSTSTSISKTVQSTIKPVQSITKPVQSITKPLPSVIEPVKNKSVQERKETSETKIRYSKEANKSYYGETTKEYAGNINIFKDRPGISITPIQNLPSMPIPKPPLPTSPGKTLQQKLAERQKQNPAAQQKVNIVKNPPKHENPNEIMTQLQSLAQKNISFPKPNVPTPQAHSTPFSKNQNTAYRNLQPNIPSSLTITKSQTTNVVQGLHTGDSGISIIPQLPLPSGGFKPDVSKLMNFRKPPVPKIKLGGRKLGSEITVTPNFNKPNSIDGKLEFPPNIPMSISVLKKDTKNDPKPTGETVEIITIE